MADAASLAADLAKRLAVAKEELGHQDCRGGAYDPEHGLMCGCGVLLEATAELNRVPPGPSATTLASQGARPVDVVPMERDVTAALDGDDAGGPAIASRVHPADPIVSKVDVIDPTRPYTPAEVEEHILDAVARLERGAHYQRVCEEDLYAKRMKYDLAHARAVVEASKRGGAQDVRSAYALVENEALFNEMMVAKMKVEAIRNTMHSLRSVLSGYQSVSRSVQSAMSGSTGRSF